MVAAGDLRRADTVYRLSDRLLERQRRQDDAVHPETVPWDGDWEMVVVTATGRGPAERAELRSELTRLRLAELREGVWLRPANLLRPLPDSLGQVAERGTARPDRPARELAANLWPLHTWVGRGHALLDHVARERHPSERFAAFAAVVRHLLADPVLPPELLAADWPGERLRAAYADYRRELAAKARARDGREAAEDVRARGRRERRGGRTKRRAGTLRTAAFTVGGSPAAVGYR
jgi:phenylacetic acid degradation operon negative regulatory protein